jgi:hypothetical protein
VCIIGRSPLVAAGTHALTLPGMESTEADRSQITLHPARPRLRV